MSAEIKIRRQAGMLIRRPVLVDKLPLSVSVHYGLDSLSAIADFQDYTISIAYSGPSKLRECPPPHLRDPHAGDFHRASACDHALGPCSRHPGADEINQEIDREPVREHDRLAAAVGGCGEQFEGAAALGLRACGVNRLPASRPFCSGGGAARWVVSCAYIRWTPWPSKTRLQRST